MRMKNKGSITIYLSIILVSVLLVVSVISESGRVNAIQTKSRSTAYVAAESVMAGYAKQIYRDYGVLLVWENETLEEQLKKYIQDNINMTSLKGESTDFTACNLVNVKVKGPAYVIEDAEGFTEQIMSYMKYAGTIEAVTKLVEEFEKYSEENEVELPENNDVTHIEVDEKCNELIAMVEKISKLVADIKDTKNLENKLSEASQKLEILKGNISDHTDQKNHRKKVKKFLEKYRELMAELDRKSSNVNDAINQIKQYDEKKELFLKEKGYTAGDGDYIDENLEILENVKDEIEKNRELAISKYSEIDSNNIETVNSSIKNLEIVKNKLQSLQNEVTEQDKENQSVYESAAALLKKSVLSLVIDDVSDMSDSAISLSNLPTTLNKTAVNKSSIIETVKNRATISIYAGMKFGNYLSPKKETALKYEMEYIIGGQSSDVDNLIKTVEKIVAVRNVINLAVIMTDKEKMEQVSAVSASVATALGLPFLEPVAKVILTEAWALAESVYDVKELIRGGKIPLLKNSKNWSTSLESLLDNKANHYEGKKGLDYETYLKLLLMLENNSTCVYRIMDLIQVNVQKRYNRNFLMSKCVQNIEFTANFEIEPLFTAMPWAIKNLSENHGDYQYEIKCNYSY